MNNKVSVFGQRRAGVYLLSEIYNPDDVTSSVQNINKVVPAIGSLVVDDTVGNHNTLYVVYSVDPITHRSTLVNACILDTTDDSTINFSYGNNNYKLFFSETPIDVYFKTKDTTPQPSKLYYTRQVVNDKVIYTLFTELTFSPNVTYYESVKCYEAAVDSRLAIYNNDAVSFTVFRSVAINATDGNNDVISWYYKLSYEEDSDPDFRYRKTKDTAPIEGKAYYTRNEVDDNITYIPFTGNEFLSDVIYYEEAYEISKNGIVHNSKIPLDTYTDRTTTHSGEITAREAKCTRYFYTPFELVQGEKYLVVVNDAQNRTVAQVVLDGQPMCALQELNEKYRVITSFDVWTDYSAKNIVYIPRFSSIDTLQFYFDITYNDGVVDQLPGIDNVRIFAYGLEDVDTFAAIDTEYEVLFKYFVPSIEQVGLNETFERNYEIGPTKRYIYKRVYVRITGDIPAEDTTPPWITNIRADITTPTNQNVTVTAEFHDNVAVRERTYRIGEDGRWEPYPDGGVTVTDNCTIYFKAVDTSGNESTIESYTVNNIDRIPPAAPIIVNVVPNALTTLHSVMSYATVNNVAVTIRFAEDSVKNEYSIDGGTTWTDMTGSNVYTTEQNKPDLQFKSTDAAGNESTVTPCSIENIDTVIPEVYVRHTVSEPQMTSSTVDATAVKPTDGTGNDTVIVNYDGSAALPSRYPTARIEYKVPLGFSVDGVASDNQWHVYTGPFNVSSTQSGDCVIDFAAYDGIYDGTQAHNGNRSVTTQETISFVVVDQPSATVTTNIPQGTWVQGPVTATITYANTDSKNHREYYIYYLTPGSGITPSIVDITNWSTDPNGANPIIIDNITGNCMIYTKATNSVGEVSYGVYGITTIDTTGPSIQVQVSNTSTGSPVWVKGPVKVKAVITDTESGINPNTVYYKLGSGNWTAYALDSTGTGTEIPVSTNGTVVSFKAKNNAGQESTNSVTVTNIDAYAPEIESSSTLPSSWVPSFNMVVRFIDGGAASDRSGINKCYYQINNGSPVEYTNGTVVTLTSNCVITFWAVDNVENESTHTPFNIQYISSGVPIITCYDVSNYSPAYGTQGATEYWTNSDVTVTAKIESSDGLAAINKVYYRVITNPNDPDSSIVKASTEVTPSSLASNTWTADGITGVNGYVQFKATTNSGVSSDWVTVHQVTKIDKVAPVITSVTSNVNPSTEVRSQILTINYDQNTHSDVTNRYYYYSETQISNPSNITNWSSNSGNTLTVSNNGYYYFKLKDHANNYSNIVEYHVTNIVTGVQSPIVALSPAAGPASANGYVTSVEVSVDYRDAATGTGNRQYRVKGASTWLDYNGPFTVSTNDVTYEFIGRKAGIDSEITEKLIDYIDTTAPELTASKNPTTGTHNSVTVTATASDTQSGVQCVGYRVLDISDRSVLVDWTPYPQVGVVCNNNCIVQFRAMDNCNNKTDADASGIVEVTVNNIANYTVQAPQISANPNTQTSNPVTVSIAYDAGNYISSREYKIVAENGVTVIQDWTSIPSGSTSYTLPQPITSNCIIYARNSDGLIGGTKEAQLTIDYIVAAFTVTVTRTYVTDNDATIDIVSTIPCKLKYRTENMYQVKDPAGPWDHSGSPVFDSP